MNANLIKADKLVFIGKGRRLVTTSVIVANEFERQHKDVLRAIKNLDCSEEFGRRSFTPTSYTDQWNRRQEMIQMNRDGFMFLAMGFNGKKAARLKEVFIDHRLQPDGSLDP